MRYDVKDWVAIAEVIGTVAVIVSLIFVARSINQNTMAIEAAESNNIWTAWRDVAILPVINNKDFADVYAKSMASVDLSDAEQAQWDHYLAGQIDIWAQLFDLHKDGLISDEKWAYWDDGYWRAWETGMYNLIWEKNAAIYDRRFQDYIEAGRRNASAIGE